MANIKWLEPGTAATGNLSLYSATSNGSSATTPVHTGSRSLQVLAGGGTAPISAGGILADAGRRISFYYRTAGTNPGSAHSLILFMQSGGGNIGGLAVNTSGQLCLGNGLAGINKASTTTVNDDQWHRISLSYVITATNNFTMKLWVDGSLILTATQADFTFSVVSTDKIMFRSGYDTNDSFFSDIYVDDGTTLDDPGDIRVTTKRPNATSTNNFDTLIGSSASRWTAEAELPISATNGYVQTGNASAIEETYGIEAIGAGDSDQTGNTLLGRMAWASAKRGASGVTGGHDYATSTSSSTKTTTTALAAVTTLVGDLVVVAFADQIGGTQPTIADNFTNTWNILSGPTTSTVRLIWWYAIIASGKAGSMTVTITHDNSSGKRALGLVGISECISATPLDKNPTNLTDGTSQYDGPSTTTLAQANEVCIGCFAFAGPNDDTKTDVSPDTTRSVDNGTTGGSATANASLVMYVRRVAATTAVVMSMQRGTNRAGVQSIASFKTSGDTTSVGAPKITDVGSDSAVTLTTTAATYQLAPVTSGTYPSGAAIGMKSSGTGVPTFMYDCGQVLAFSQAAVVAAKGAYASATHTIIGGIG